MTEPILAVENLEVAYGAGSRALHGVSLSVRARSYVGLVGLNGAGKTTTLRAISGFSRFETATVTGGRIRFGGIEITGWQPHQTCGVGISLVAERDKVFLTLTVQENLEIAVQGRRATREGQVIREVLDVFPALAGLRRRQAGLLSGGERQLLATAAALVSDPKLLLVDEATLGLSPVAADTVLEKFRELKEQRELTLLLVDQNVQAVLDVCDYSYVIANGVIVARGTSEELEREGAIEELGFGLSKEPTT
ncbi:MAG TPA: ATP-binding cassette domain-containing protein [Methylomirabilota bacterium]|nr:ATP-binding cassette domain-containing protein [Methylomirabilota bacterium]